MSPTAHWLDDYGGSRFEWQHVPSRIKNTYCRPVGHVEFSFDTDGRFHEGRADMNVQTGLEVKSRLSPADLKEKILLAWTCLRCQHLGLQAKAVNISDVIQDDSREEYDVYLRIDVPTTVETAIKEAKNAVVFLEDHYLNVDPSDFWYHSQNTTRQIDPSKALAKVFVFPLVPLGEDRYDLRFLTIASHQIWDGLSMHVWQRDFVHWLNKPAPQLLDALHNLLDPATIEQHLPIPQEALYPSINGSPARRRWFWVITRILRHVRKPLPAGFSNPLQRRQRLDAIALSPTYAAALDYSRIPPVNTYQAKLSDALSNSQRLLRLCREAGVSVGAGGFALAALGMMEIYEQRQPDIPLAERKPFISGFPLDPRAFFNHHNEPNSLMLAFCDGIVLPFLPSSLDLDGRIRLLARQAHRQLATYQKRRKPAGSEATLQYMSCRGAGRLIANQYISSLERGDAMLPEHLRRGIEPQGAYPARPNMTYQTCGVSSIGRRDAVINHGMYDLDESDDRDFVADFRSLHAGVRAREGECLIGISGANGELHVTASIDVSSIDIALVNVWMEKMQHILDIEPEGQRARL